MHVHLLAIGSRMPAWVDAGVAEYAKRLSGDVRFQVDAIALPKRGEMPVAQRLRQETELLEKRLEKYPHAEKVALEVQGKRLTTHQLAEHLGRLRDEGRDLCLLVGGPDGLDPALSRACARQWSLSDLTLPHPLVRLLVSEQVYRGWSLLHDHPYHR
jgi:23S rRNA (pseudouridine1915-N3)-methyltransferase